MKISVKCFLEFKKLTKQLVILNMYSTLDMSSITQEIVVTLFTLTNLSTLQVGRQ